MTLEELLEYHEEKRDEYIDLYNSLFPNDRREYNCGKCYSEVYQKLIWLKNKDMAQTTDTKKYKLKPGFEDQILVSKTFGKIPMKDITSDKAAEMIKANPNYAQYFEESK